MADQTQNSGLVLEASLQSFFYDQLQKVNQKFSKPLPKEAIFYSSLVMDKFGDTQNYFENSDGRLRNKTLGLKLLECSEMSPAKKKRTLIDIGDTALLLCGYFSESLNKKLVDEKYYKELGQIAYSRLNHLIPDVYEVPSFFKLLSKSFHDITLMMNLVAKESLEKVEGMNSPMLLVINDVNKIKVS
ncbi:MAG: hypothetical protein HN509_05055 [Halobacteriovoraceae bacterium]|jgi:hypothetical protein|nr:hypothetical protein [Halobacteriovoraceae bacterium]MBT5093287.1 hypothetical protein [Halobacteriovoraceae bacterium]